MAIGAGNEVIANKNSLAPYKHPSNQRELFFIRNCWMQDSFIISAYAGDLDGLLICCVSRVLRDLDIRCIELSS